MPEQFFFHNPFLCWFSLLLGGCQDKYTHGMKEMSQGIISSVYSEHDGCINCT